MHETCAPNDSSETACPRCGYQGASQTKHTRDRRVEELLKTNASPLESEIFQMLELTSRKASTVSELDKKIKETRLILEHLVTERDQAAQDLNDYRIITNPLRRLPADILCEIFLSCISEDVLDVEKFESSLNVRAFPWTLVQVCSRWRSIGLSLQKLWSTVIVSVDDLGKDGIGSIRMLGLQLQRSGVHPLSVWIDCESDPSDLNIPFANPIFNMLLPTSSRWREAILSFLNSFHPLASIRGSLESLRCVHLELSGTNTAEVAPSCTDFLEFAPRLTDVRLLQTPVVLSYKLPWSQLKSLTWSDLDDHHALPLILRQTHDLEFLLFKGVDFPEDYSGPIIRLEHLDELVAEVNMGFIRHLLLPSLSFLEICDVTGNLDIVASLLSRSQCLLTKLTLSIKSMTDDDAVRLLSCMPALEVLELQSGAFTTDILVKQLTAKEGHKPLAPRLECLRLGVPLTDDVSLFVSMVESRCVDDTVSEDTKELENRVARLETVVLTFAEELEIADPEVMARWKGCILRGLEVIFEYSAPDPETDTENTDTETSDE